MNSERYMRIERHKLRVVFRSKEITGDDMERFFQWHRLLRDDPRYGGVPSLEPATRVDKQLYKFRRRAIEFFWIQWHQIQYLGEAAEAVGGMHIEYWSQHTKWQKLDSSQPWPKDESSQHRTS